MDAQEATFAGAGVRLAGAITWPHSAGTCPGVVLIGGSGPSDRRNDGFFDPIRHHLAAAGVAVLAHLTTPTLVIFGADDPLVPIDASVARYESTASAAGRHQQTRVLPGVGHRLRTAEGLAPGYLAQLAD